MTVSDNNRIDRAERSGSSDARLRSAVIAPPARSLVRSARALAAAALLALSGALAPPAAAQTAPAAPTNFTAAAGNARVGLSWDAPATGSGVTRHEYRYRTGGGSYPATWTQIEDSGVGGANEDGYPVPGLTNETAHTFELRAVSAGGAGAAAEAGPVTPTPGICERTQQVRDEILDELAGVSDCAAVTAADLATIISLDLDYAGLTSLQAGDFAGLTELTGLGLVGNSLSSLPETVFSGLAKLQHLLLSDNNLGSLPAGVFSGLLALVEIDLNANESLGPLPGTVFSGLGKLADLKLSYTGLETLPAELFSGLPELLNLNLNGNRITELPAGVFSGLPQLEELDLSDNTADPLELTVTLEKAGTGQVRAKVLAGAPFAVELPVTVANGALAGGATVLGVAAGSVDGAPVMVTRTAGTTAVVTADVDLTTQPSLPSRHRGYVFARAASGLPAEVLPAVRPAITGVAVTSKPELESDTYGRGETIRFTVTFSEKVDVTGSPHFTFSLGNRGAARRVDAPYESGSGTAALVFAYQVVSSDVDDNGIFLLVGSDFDDRDGPVAPDAGESVTAVEGGVAADLAHDTGRGTQSDHQVDGSRPTPEGEEEPEENRPSAIRTYWTTSETKASNEQVDCAGTESFRAYWHPPLERKDGGVRRYKVADEWEADLRLQRGASDVSYTIQDTGGNPENPELTGSVRLKNGNGSLSIRVRGRFGADGWGAWSPRASLNCKGTASGSSSGAEALTAEFRGLPSAHDGRTAFRFRIEFSEAVAASAADMRDEGLIVTGGKVTAASPLDGRTGRWSITVTPSGAGATRIVLPPGRDCAAAGAICTADGRQLSTALVTTVPGPPVEPLKAWFFGMPAEHNGKHGIRFRVAFSEDIGIGTRALREHAFTVTGGRVTGGRWVDDRRDLFEMTVRPESFTDVTITLPGGRACDVSGAICTKGDNRRQLTNTPAATVRGPVGISVADARVEEGADAELVFAVTLSRAAHRTLGVNYRTADGSAHAGDDYRSAKGTLKFRAGELSKRIEVAVLDDDHDEGEETLTLTLSNPSSGRLTDGEATGTIVNHDPLPRALLARFGRTAAVHVVEQVEERLEARRAPGFEGRFAGQELRPGMGRDIATDVLRRLGGLADAAGTATGGSGLEGTFGGEGLLRLGGGGGDVLSGSSFALNRSTRHGGILSVWSRGARSQFSGREGGLSLGGDVRTTMFGADYARGSLTAGVSLSHSGGVGQYAGADSGEVVSSVTGLYPWLGYQATDRLSVWGVAGYGSGALALTPEGGMVLESDLGMAMAALGARGELFGAGGAAGYGLAFKADALWVGTSIKGVDGPSGRLKATAAAVTRLRTALEASRGFRFGSGLSLKPSVEVGVRRDGGDAETGAGVDIGSGLVVSAPSVGLSADVRMRMLVAHAAAEFGDRGVSVSLSYNPTPSTPFGLRARLAPSWGGQATNGAEALWGRETMAGMAPGGFDAAGNRLVADIGYGLPVGRRFVGTPRLGVVTSGMGRDYRLGCGLGVLDGGEFSFELGIDAQRRETLLAGGVNHGVAARATLSW